MAGQTESQIVRDMGKHTQRKKDFILRQAITAHLGRSNWEMEELKGRCHCYVRGYARQDERTETFCVDGVSLVTFYAEKVTTVNNGQSVNMHVEVKYQLHIRCDIEPGEVDRC
jgi:hypothetical protein